MLIYYLLSAALDHHCKVHQAKQNIFLKIDYLLFFVFFLKSFHHIIWMLSQLWATLPSSLHWGRTVTNDSTIEKCMQESRSDNSIHWLVQCFLKQTKSIEGENWNKRFWPSMNRFYVIFKHKKKPKNVCWFQLLKCKDLLLFLVIYDSKWKVFGFWAVGG